jgi:hypothetical protein
MSDDPTTTGSPLHPGWVTPRVLTTSDSRLTRLMQRDPLRCATINEYAQATGIDAGEIVELLGVYLDDGSLSIEVHGDDVFLHTAPDGRPAPDGLVDVPANLWELLRVRFSVPHAHQLWRLTRALEAAGWRVEHQPGRIMFGLGRLHEAPLMGVDVGNTVVPLLLFPSPVALTAPDGLLNTYENAGAAAVGIVCAQGALDEMATTVRAWMLSRQTPPPMSVLLLESPRFNPTLLSPGDGAITPRSVAINVLETGPWGSTG